jgi:hypothetical protein
MTNPGNKRAQRARSGVGGRGDDGKMSQLSNGKGGFTPVSNGSVINWGGNKKFGLYPTVGVSVGFLNILSSCCRKTKNGTSMGVNVKNDPNSFLM